MRYLRTSKPPSAITDESVYLARREWIRKVAMATPALLAGCDDGTSAEDASVIESPGMRRLATAERTRDAVGEVRTRERDATQYNNFYEFGTGKGDPARYAGRMHTEPWTVEVAGECERAGTFSVDDVLSRFPLEERVYRLRCVEAWSMVIPWVGIPLGNLLRRFKPTSRAKYVAFVTAQRPAEMPGLAYRVLDWPYREGLRIDEAMHPLTLLAVGMYGHVLPNQNGAPLRLVVPWKYGFKSVKSIVRITFTETQPRTSWNMAAPAEYGFYSNVNPDVSHPRWSQATERRIAGDGFDLLGNRIETLPFNGYADEVASLYAGMDLRRNF